MIYIPHHCFLAGRSAMGQVLGLWPDQWERVLCLRPDKERLPLYCLFVNANFIDMQISLKGIEEFTKLRVLYISRTGITDLTPLLALTDLKEVYISSDMMGYFDEIRDMSHFEVFIY
jgi:hypothetical protein